MVRGVGLVLGACRPRGVSVRVCHRVLTGGLPGSAPAVPRPSVPRPSPALRGFCRSRGSTVAGRFSLRLPPRPSSRLPPRPVRPARPGSSRCRGGRGGGEGTGRGGRGRRGLPSCGGGVVGGSGASVVGPARRSRCSLVRRGASARARTGAGPLVRGGSRPLSPPVRAARSSPFALASRPRIARSVPRALPLTRAPILPPSLARSLSLSRLPPRLGFARAPYLVDPASSICLSQRLSHACLSTHGRYSETANGSLNQLWFLWSLAPLLLG